MRSRSPIIDPLGMDARHPCKILQSVGSLGEKVLLLTWVSNAPRVRLAVSRCRLAIAVFALFHTCSKGILSDASGGIWIRVMLAKLVPVAEACPQRLRRVPAGVVPHDREFLPGWCVGLGPAPRSSEQCSAARRSIRFRPCLSSGSAPRKTTSPPAAGPRTASCAARPATTCAGPRPRAPPEPRRPRTPRPGRASKPAPWSRICAIRAVIASSSRRLSNGSGSLKLIPANASTRDSTTPDRTPHRNGTPPHQPTPEHPRSQNATGTPFWDGGTATRSATSAFCSRANFAAFSFSACPVTTEPNRRVPSRAAKPCTVFADRSTIRPMTSDGTPSYACHTASAFIRTSVKVSIRFSTAST